MFGLMILVAIYLVLGFMLAWIVGIVAKEEIAIKTGVVILIITAIIGIPVRIALAESAPDLAPVAMPAINFVVLTLLVNMMTRIGWKYSVIVAAICSVLLLGVGMGLQAAFAS